MVTKVKLSNWVEHLAQAQAQGMTLARYARAHGLSIATLYAARQEQRKHSAVQTKGAGSLAAASSHQGRAARSAFVAVRLPGAAAATPGAALLCSATGATSSTLQARLPNGVQISIDINAPQESHPHAPWVQVLHALSTLPCSR